MLHGRQRMLIGCFIAFDATLSVFFQTDKMFPYLKEKAPLVLLRWLTQTTLLQVREQQLLGLLVCQQDILWAPSFFLPSLLLCLLPSPIRLNDMELFVGLEVATVQPTPSQGAKGLKQEKTYRTFVHFPAATQAAKETAQAMIQLLSSPRKRVRKLPLLFFSSKGSRCETWHSLDLKETPEVVGLQPGIQVSRAEVLNTGVPSSPASFPTPGHQQLHPARSSPEFPPFPFMIA